MGNAQNVNNLDMKQEKYDKMKAKLFSAQAQNQQQNEQNDEEKVSVHSIAEEREGQTPKQKEIAAPNTEKNEKSKSAAAKMEQTEGQRNEASKDKKENNKESAVKSNLNQIKKKCKGWSLVKPKRTTDINHTELFKESRERLKALAAKA